MAGGAAILNAGQLLRLVQPEEEGQRLDRWLRTRFPALSFARLHKLLRTGQIRVDGRRARGDLRLRAGQQIRIPPALLALEADRSAPPAPDPVWRRWLVERIRYEDEALWVVDKPAGLAVQGGPKTPHHLDRMLTALATDGRRPRLVHRLDRDTAGLLVVARDAAAARALSQLFRSGRVRKLYWAVVLGLPPRAVMTVDLPLAKQGAPGRARVVPNAPGAKPARTRLRVVGRAGKVGAWLALEPETGRTHQLRAHLAALGCPILGDRKYGGDAAVRADAPAGLMLQAMELDFPHPLRGGRVRVRGEAAPHLREALAWLGFSPEDPPLPPWLDDLPGRTA